jgi:hypothetical protein
MRLCLGRDWSFSALGALRPRADDPVTNQFVASFASCRANRPGCDGGRRRPKTKCEIGTTLAELTTATTGAHSQLVLANLLAASTGLFSAVAKASPGGCNVLSDPSASE